MGRYQGGTLSAGGKARGWPVHGVEVRGHSRAYREDSRRGARMNRAELLEVEQLASALCPVVLQDLSHMTMADLRGVLTWLRILAREVSA